MLEFMFIYLKVDLIEDYCNDSSKKNTTIKCQCHLIVKAEDLEP